jgi:hypothetical protein
LKQNPEVVIRARAAIRKWSGSLPDVPRRSPPPNAD